MRFAFDTAIKNIKKKPFRAAAMVILVLFLSFTVFTGAFTVISLQRGLDSYQLRLGADIVVIPNSAKGHGSVDDILLQGITGNYYMAGKEVEKVRAIEGISEITTQFFLTSAKTSCCSVKVQIIGFDPDTDFSIQPWISESYADRVADGDIIAGSSITVPADRTITFYGQEYRVAAQLAETGTGLDSAVYVNMNTMKEMASNAARLLETSPFQGVDINTAASAVLIRVAKGYEISDVTDDINIHITKVQASSARNMISQISEGLGGVSRVIGLLVGAVWVLALIILITVFILVSNERRKEFAILRIMGASRKMLFKIMGCESLLISTVGAVLGLIIAGLLLLSLSGSLKEMLRLPLLTPGTGTVIILCICAFAAAVLAGLVTALVSARRITKSETGLLLREDG